MILDKKFRLRSSIGLVNIGTRLEMFKANIRESVSINIEYEGITNFLLKFDGERTVNEILVFEPEMEPIEVRQLIEFLVKNFILIEVDKKYPQSLVETDYRLISFVEDYCPSTSDVMNRIQSLAEKSVAIIGLGAVGTWVSDALVRSGLKKITLIDDDIVELTNLHRQDLFFEGDVGRKKIDCVAEQLNQIADIEVSRIYEKLDEDFFKRNNIDCDLIINCADYPSVDATSEIVGKYCMQTMRPHLIGGGYNLHLTLIGQTVIPGKTACVKCFAMELKKINEADLNGVRKLNRDNRKIGSFGPICSISASITSIEALKVLMGFEDFLINTNKRIEFRIGEQDFISRGISKNEECEWCGKNSAYVIC